MLAGWWSLGRVVVLWGRRRRCGSRGQFRLEHSPPFEQEVNPWIAEDPKLINFKYFFTRKLFFVKEASAVCLCPGGFGTFDEAFEVLTLVQTGKTSIIPIVLLDVPGGGIGSTGSSSFRCSC